MLDQIIKQFQKNKKKCIMIIYKPLFTEDVQTIQYVWLRSLNEKGLIFALQTIGMGKLSLRFLSSQFMFEK